MFSMVMMAALAGPGAEAPAFFFRKHGCHGCWSCSGCYGCSGCWGCHGCHSYARVSYGCYGCTGCTGCYGCYGYVSYAAPAYPSYHYPVYYGAPVRSAEPLPAPAPKKEEKTPQGQAANRARLIVELPTDAKLYIDDQPTRAAGITRTIATPELQSGEEYYYLLRAETVRDGKPVTDTQRVTFRAGSEIRVAFPNLPAETTTAASGSR